MGARGEEVEVEVGGLREQPLLAAEVADHQRRVDLGPRRDPAHRCPFVTLRREQRPRRGEDRGPGPVGFRPLRLHVGNKSTPLTNATDST